jgi:hypothetical protein
MKHTFFIFEAIKKDFVVVEVLTVVVVKSLSSGI